MHATSIRHLQVWRRLADGGEVLVGELAQNRQGTFFQYDAGYLEHGHSLSPFGLSFDHSLIHAPNTPHAGLHGLFADSLPDGWGMLLMDRVFRQKGIAPQNITPMDRLAYIGRRGTGALHYTPAMESEGDKSPVEIATLGEQATLVFEGQANDVLTALANAGGSGGARPKALIYFDPDLPEQVYTSERGGREQAWLIKFTSAQLPLEHDEGLCEAAWLTLAGQCGIAVPEYKLFPQDNGRTWLAVKRFDCVDGIAQGRHHMQTLCGLLDVDFRQPSMDYEDLIKASQILCQSPAVGRTQFIRAMFNLFGANQDDHTRNWSFVMSDQGQWQPSPMYDVTYSPTPYNEHAMAFGGYDSKPPLKVVQKLASYANYGSWKDAQKDLQMICDVLAGWPGRGKELGVKPERVNEIGVQLNRVYGENKGLL